ncbi:MAG: hypothetical protein WBE13_12240 [Candidatus Acidiferrum sp.]
MNRSVFVISILCASLLAFLIPSSATADEWNEKTIITFSQPVELPGIVLPAGTYTFKLLDSQADRHIVQVFNKNQTHLYATIMAIPDYRLTPRGKTVIKFAETPAGNPEAIKAWFYPGDNFGQEFVYPKSRAMELAKQTNTPVLAMPESEAANMKEPIKSAKEPAVVAMEKSPVNAETPEGNEEASAAVVSSTPAGKSSTMEAKNENSEKLPKTASELPLLGLLGMLLLAGGFGLRLITKRALDGAV